jgi:hypothetical protein
MREKTLAEKMLPLPPITPLPPGKRESDDDIYDLRLREKEAMHLWAERLMVELVDMWRWCGHAVCRRARQCATPNVACFKPNEKELRQYVRPVILDMIANGKNAPPPPPAPPRRGKARREARRRTGGR